MSIDQMPWWVTSDPDHPAMRPMKPEAAAEAPIIPEVVADTATDAQEES